MTLCDRCHSPCTYGDKEIKGEIFCTWCAEIIEEEIAQAAADTEEVDETYRFPCPDNLPASFDVGYRGPNSVAAE